MNDSLAVRPNETSLNSTIISNHSAGGNSDFIITAVIRHEIFIGTVILGCLSYFGAFVTLLLLVGAWPKSAKSGFDLLMYHFIVLHFSMNFINQPIFLFLSEAVANNRWIPANFCLYTRPFFSLIELTINICDAEMAVNRVVALFFPHHYAIWTSKPVVTGMIIFSWLFCAVWYFMPLAYNSIYAIISMTPLGICIWSPQNSGVINIISFTMLVAVPYAVSGIGAVLIIWQNWYLTCMKRRFWTCGREGTSEAVVAPTRALRRRLRKSRMLLLTFIWTGLCITPGNVVAYAFMAESISQPMLWFWMKAPSTLQYSLTPCILLFCNTECRARLRAIITNRIPTRISTADSLPIPGGSSALNPHSNT